MKRTIMQIYVKGSVEAVEFYQKAFDAPLVAAFKNDDGTYAHAELDVYGQIIAVAEDSRNMETSKIMQYCLHFQNNEKDKITKAYDVLSINARELYEPLGSGSYSPYMAQFVDKYGVHWCMFIEAD